MKKENKATEAIRKMVLRPKAIDLLIETYAKQAVIFGRIPFDEQFKKKLRAYFSSDDFLRPFADRFEALFTNAEISRLIEIYESNVMEKWFENAEIFLNPLYKTMHDHVDQISPPG